MGALTYVPNEDGIVLARPIGALYYAIDARSTYFDIDYYVRRPFSSLAFVKSYFPLEDFRRGMFSIYVNETGVLNTSTGYLEGGVTKEYWWKEEDLSDDGLVEKTSDLTDFATITYVDAQIDPLLVQIGDIDDQLQEVTDDLVQETSDRQTGDQVNADAILAETTRAISAETLNASSITTETARAIAIENTKANAADIVAPIVITYADLVGGTYTNLSLANASNVRLSGESINGSYNKFISFNSSGVATIPADLINADNQATFKAEISGTTGLLSDFNSLKEKVDRIPYKFYNFQGFDTNSIVGQSAVALLSTYSITANGLQIVYGVSTAGRTAWYSNLGVDNSKEYYALSLRTTVVSFNAGATFGFAFGTYGSNLFSIGYHENGSLTTNINNTIANLRPATPAYAFLPGDIIGIDCIIDKSNGLIKDIVTSKSAVSSSDVYTLSSVSDFTTFYLYRRTRSTSDTNVAVNQLIAPIPVEYESFYVDGTNGLDSNKGTSASPFKTMDKAFSSCVGNIFSKIFVLEGIYRASWTTSVLTFETVQIIAKTPELVQMFGSNAVIGWSKTSGKTNVYQAAFSSTIPTGSVMGKVIFEHGNSTKAILTSERDALQRNLSSRLPFYPLLPVASVDLCDSTQGSFFQDTVNNLLYIHSGNSSSPLTNGFSYENISRPAITVADSGFDPSRKATIILKNIQFLYTTNGVKLNGFSRVERYMCTSLASQGTGGFVDDAPFFIAYKDETGYCDGDGSQGHYNVVSGYTTKDQREGVMNGWYIDIWCHDNFDDGLSFHERADVTIQGGLFEYNGDGGVRQAADADIRIYNAIARNNGWDNSAGTSGSGFDCTNSPSANRGTGSLSLFNCVSYGNRKGIAVITGGATLNAYNCTTRNNTEAEYYAETGVLNANNCRATNANSAKLKVTSGSGVINVLSDPLLT